MTTRQENYRELKAFYDDELKNLGREPTDDELESADLRVMGF